MAASGYEYRRVRLSAKNPTQTGGVLACMGTGEYMKALPYYTADLFQP